MTDFAGIINIAAVGLGVEPVSSSDDDVKIANLARVRWDTVRRAVLRDHPWNCASRRVALVKLTAAPAYGYANQFALPDDCLRVLEVENNDAQYRVENLKGQGAVLLTDAPTVSIVYIADIDDPTLFDAALTEALGAKLAAVLALNLTGSQATADAKTREYGLTLGNARSIDAQESGPEQLEADGWVRSRWGDDATYRPIASGS
jgi:hypothetical protein